MKNLHSLSILNFSLPMRSFSVPGVCPASYFIPLSKMYGTQFAHVHTGYSLYMVLLCAVSREGLVYSMVTFFSGLISLSLLRVQPPDRFDCCLNSDFLLPFSIFISFGNPFPWTVFWETPVPVVGAASHSASWAYVTSACLIGHGYPLCLHWDGR